MSGEEYKVDCKVSQARQPCVCVCVCVIPTRRGVPQVLKIRVKLLFLTRPCGHVWIKYSVFVESNPITIKYAFNFNFIAISLYGSNFTFINFIILSLFSGLYRFRSAGRSLYYYLLSLITTVGLIILALAFLISIEPIEILLRTAPSYIYISVCYSSHISYLFIICSFEIR